MSLERLTPTVSIIIPTYNRAHVLSRAIQSVLAQTYQDFELIIVDDGSTDDTERLVKSFNSEKIRYIRHIENKGPAAARNNGIQSAKGDYIAFQDSDDEWMPQKLEKQMRAFETAPPEVGVVYTGSYIIKNNRKWVAPHGGLPPPKDGDIFFSQLKGRFVLPSATVIKGECFARAGTFDERFFPIEDSELFLRFSRHYQFKCINEPLIIYYLQPDSLSENEGARIKPYRLMLETYFEYIKQDRRVLAYHYSRLGNLLCYTGELSQGRSYLIKTIKAYPLYIKAIGAFLAACLGKNIYNIVAKSYRKIVKPF
jgi:glycosyltransferase involved in cell wall biosynthesis